MQKINVCQQSNRRGSVRNNQEGNSQKRVHNNTIPPEREQCLQEFKTNNHLMTFPDSGSYFICKL